MDLSAPVEHTLFTLDKPSRVVIDILDTDATRANSGTGSGSVRSPKVQ